LKEYKQYHANNKYSDIWEEHKESIWNGLDPGSWL